MSRKPIFDAIKAARNGQRFEPEEVTAIDAFLDGLEVPREAPETGDVGMRPSGAAFALIRSFEGCHRKRPDGRIEAYPDPATGGDPWTIGWGSTGPDIRKGTTWTQQEADARFEADVIRRFAGGVARLVDGGAATSQNEFDALVSFAYNVGLGALENSTLLKKHRAGDKAGAASEFARWNKAAGKVMNGLTRRRAAEAALYRGET